MDVIVQTATAAYVLDQANGLLTRYPRDAGDSLSVDHDVAELRKDGTAIPYRLIGELVVGQRAQFMLQIRDDGVTTLRTTTPIEALSD